VHWRRFNAKLGRQASYRALDKAALSIGDDIILVEFTLNPSERSVLLTEAEAAHAQVVWLR
jgi:hypothetical protein